jgi:hypothetical protein
MGMRVSGDLCVTERRDDTLYLAVVDVLGHGPEAHAEALIIEKLIPQLWSDEPSATLEKLHTGTLGGRGAAATVAALDIPTGRIQVAGVGNVLFRILGPSVNARAVSMDGVVGQRFRAPVQQTFTLEEGCALLVHTDGISSSFSLDDYPQLPAHGAATIARSVLRRFSRHYDDATCLVVRYAR